VKRFYLALLPIMLLGLLFTGCNCNSPQKVTKISKYNKLLSLYKPIEIDDTIRIFSTGNPDSVGYKFNGKLIDSATFRLFPGTEIYKNEYLYNQFFAIDKFDINSNCIGLITRTPSQYSCTSIKVYVYDKNLDRITDQFELADISGDENWRFEKIGWIFRNNKKELNYFTFRRDVTIHGMEIDSVAETTSTIINDYAFLYIKASKHDTIRNNVKLSLYKFLNKK